MEVLKSNVGKHESSKTSIQSPNIITHTHKYTARINIPYLRYDWESPELTGLASLTRDQTYTLFEMAAPQFDITMISCDLGGVYTPCEDIFTTVITEGGKYGSYMVSRRWSKWTCGYSTLWVDSSPT